MTEELNKEAKAEAELDGEVTDEMLSAAFDGREIPKNEPKEEPASVAEEIPAEEIKEEIVEEPAPVAEEEPPAKIEPDYDQKEGSRLGREVKRLKEIVEELTGELKGLKKPESKETPDDDDDDDGKPETIVTPEDFDRYILWKQRKEAKEFNNFATAYLKELRTQFGTEDDYEEVIGFMRSDPKYNAITTKDAAIDAQLNYNRAARILATKKLVAKEPIKKIPVKGEENADVAKGLSGTNRVTPPATTSIKLDKYAQEYADATGMTEDERKEALEGTASMSLRGSKVSARG